MIALFEGGPQAGRWTRRDVCCRFFEFPVLLESGYAVDRYEIKKINPDKSFAVYEYTDRMRLRKRRVK